MLKRVNKKKINRTHKKKKKIIFYFYLFICLNIAMIKELTSTEIMISNEQPMISEVPMISVLRTTVEAPLFLSLKLKPLDNL